MSMMRLTIEAQDRSSFRRRWVCGQPLEAAEQSSEIFGRQASALVGDADDVLFRS